MRLAYLGTPSMSVPPLRALVDAGHDVALVVSRADAKRGRGGGLQPSPVKAAALDLGLPVTDGVDAVLDADVELGVVVAYGRIIKPHVLAAVPMINLHFSLLPRWRGAAPVERAILAGDQQTGVDLMVVEEGLDTGGIFRRAVLDVGDDETVDELRRRLVDAGTALLIGALRDGLGEPVPQEGEPVYAHKIESRELEIDWSRPAIDIHRLVRVGGAHTTWRGKRLKVWRTALESNGDGIAIPAGDAPITVLEVQPEGKARMEARAWANGAQWRDGQALGT